MTAFYRTFCARLFTLGLVGGLSSYTALAPAGSLVRLAKLPAAVTESSGLEKADGPRTYWTHSDAGNSPTLYKIDETGKLLQTVTVPGATNTDWEDLAQDSKGNLYIADTGNNKSKREQLTIYKVSPKTGFKAQALTFKYPDYPTTGKIDKPDRNFDCEAFFWHGNKLYLISKDRGGSKTAKLYALPDSPGAHTAKLLHKEELPGMVTSADLSPDGRHLAVLTYGKLYLYPVAKGTDKFFAQKPRVLDLYQAGQVEAVLFKDNQQLIISNEEGNLYQYAL